MDAIRDSMFSHVFMFHGRSITKGTQRRDVLEGGACENKTAYYSFIYNDPIEVRVLEALCDVSRKREKLRYTKVKVIIWAKSKSEMSAE